MADIVFEVDDSSPAISYFPFGDTFSTPNLNQGWNPYYETSGFATFQGDQGVGSSFHITSLNGASITIQWNGTGIQLLGNVTDASYSIVLDNSTIGFAASALPENVLVSVVNLEDDAHILTLKAEIPSSQSLLVFDKAVITSPPATATEDQTFSQQPLDEEDILFRGAWSFQNEASGQYRRSNTLGDRVQSTFLGTSLMIHGSISPDAGNYSVTLDDVKRYFSAKSSFTQPNSLFFFASGLDSQSPHRVEIVNEDGSTLIIPVGGLVANASGSTSPPSSSPSPSSIPSPVSSAYSQGTIAALVLAGILAFLLLSGVLLYLFVYRPRRRRLRQDRRDRREQHEGETDAVLDIGPQSPKNTPALEDKVGNRRSVGGRSGFTRWKREVETGFGGMGLRGVGLSFRHSDSVRDPPARSKLDDKDQNVEEDIEQSPRNNRFTPSVRSGRSAGKGKGRWFRRSGADESSSPSYTIDLPRAPSPDEDLQPSRDGEGAHERAQEGSSGILSYMSTPSFTSPDLPPAQSSPKDSDHSVSSSMRLPVTVTKVVRPTYALTAVPFPLYSPDDRGSVRESDDETTSVLGPATAQAAIRSLSPRMSEAGSRRSVMANVPDVASPRSTEQGVSSRRAPVMDTRASGRRASMLLDVELKEGGAFRVDFDKASKMHNPPAVASGKSVRLSALTHVRFKDPSQSSAEQSQSPSLSPEEPTPRAGGFRLTPLTHPPRSFQPQTDNVRSSFIDFSGSSDVSIRSGSSEAAASSQRNVPGVSSGSQLPSRWSATTPSSITQAPDASHFSESSSSQSSAAGSPTSHNFPFPVSLPASPHHPEGHRSSPPDTALPPLNVHPPSLKDMSFTSPTDSVPMSVSEIHFTQGNNSDVGSDNDGAALPPHPPLPPPHTPQDENEFAATTSVPQRVLAISNDPISHSRTESIAGMTGGPSGLSRWTTAPRGPR